jgi:release factor glutamine methyltransferase
MSTIGEALANSRAALQAAGIESAALDARLLVSTALQVPVETVVAWPERDVGEAAAGRLSALLARRVARQPMAHLLGRREFWSLDFTVSPDVLIPRPDSETLVAAVLETVADRDRSLRLLDLGTGSGCLLLALLSELRSAQGIGVDCSDAALEIARLNARDLQLDQRARFAKADWSAGLGGIEGPFNIVIGNPPYIPSGDLARLQPEVQRDPRLALDGGPDGLHAYRRLIPLLPSLLSDDGVVALEIGEGQEKDVEAFLREAGFTSIARHKDLAGIVRCIMAERYHAAKI